VCWSVTAVISADGQIGQPTTQVINEPDIAQNVYELKTYEQIGTAGKECNLPH
jgi:hypothetical protein